MSKFTLMGTVCVVGAFFMFVFEKVSFLMERKDLIKIRSLADLMSVDWLQKIPWSAIRNAASTVVHSPLTLLLVIVGALFFLIGGLKKNV